MSTCSHKDIGVTKSREDWLCVDLSALVSCGDSFPIRTRADPTNPLATNVRPRYYWVTPERS